MALKTAAPLPIAWRGRAACLGLDTDLFFSTAPIRIARAKGVCGRCFVQTECRRTADQMERELGPKMVHGIWGGETPPEPIVRRAKRRAAR
jgi:hypothetical protein